MDSFEDDDDDELLAQMEMDPTPVRNDPAKEVDTIQIHTGEKESRYHQPVVLTTPPPIVILVFCCCGKH